MIGQILLNNNDRCYSNFSPTFREVNAPKVVRRGEATKVCMGKGAMWWASSRTLLLFTGWATAIARGRLHDPGLVLSSTAGSREGGRRRQEEEEAGSGWQ
jgi:hypothetical protein